MNNEKFTKYCKELESDIISAYEQGTTLEQAERLAAKFLGAQIEIGEKLRKADLDARMRKTGVKAIKAQVYIQVVEKSERKPSDVMIGAIVDSDNIVHEAQKSYDEAEVESAALDRYFSIFHEAHLFFRSISKGRFE